jgi:hypothetical protein
MAGTTLRDLRVRLEELERVLAEADAAANRVRAQVDGYRIVIADFESRGAPPGFVAAEVLRDEMERILEAEGQPMHRKDIYEKVVASGIRVAGDDPLSNAGAHMSADDRFRSIGNGLWGLSKWPEPRIVRRGLPISRAEPSDAQRPPLRPGFARVEDRAAGFRDNAHPED